MKIVSVIMPYYKKKNYFKEAYCSVLSQNIKSLEIIIIYDDNDHSEIKFLRKIVNNRKNTKIIINQRQLGAGLSRNIGIKMAKGKYIGFLDCDDIWKRNKLNYQINFMKRESIDFTHTSCSVINEAGRFLYNLRVKQELTYKDLIKSCDIALSTVVIRKSIFKNFKFRNITTKEDYLLWLQLSKNKIKIIGIDKIFSSWRNVRNSLSSNVLQKIKDAFKIYYIYEKRSFLIAILNIFILSFFAFKKKVL